MVVAVQVFEIRDVPRKHTAVVAFRAAPADVPAHLQRIYGEIYGAIGRARLAPDGMPFLRMLSMGPEVFDMEAGVPVAAPFAGAGEVTGGELGGCQAAVGWHIGPYEGIGATYAALQSWLEEQGRRPGGAPWESYWSDPHAEPDPAKWRTEIFWPLA